MTYSFSSQPKAIAASRGKYRDPSEADGTIYRSLKETNISWDKRVHRGNTYSVHTLNSIKDALGDVQAKIAPVRTRRRPKEASPFDLPLPEPERIKVDLTANLVAREVVISTDAAEAQTDEFLPKPDEEEYRPPKTGIDATTQVEDGELFNFNDEAEPILDVLINKTLEQSLMEVEEEHELEEMKEFKIEWRKRQETMVETWEEQVTAEWKRWQEKEAVLKKRREVRRREAEVLLKIQAMSAASKHLAGIVPNAVRDLTEAAFPDEKSMAISRDFLPQLLGKVQEEVQAHAQTSQFVSGLVRARAQQKTKVQHRALAARIQRRDGLDRAALEVRQMRRGKFRILMDTGDAEPRLVGPVQISPEDDISQVTSQVFGWLRIDPELGSIVDSWTEGFDLFVEGKRAEATAELLAAQPGQISVIPRQPPEESEGQESEHDPEEGESEGDGEPTEI